MSPRARGGDRDGTVAGASGTLPNPNTSLNPVWNRQRELLMHLLPWYTAAATAAAQVQPGNRTYTATDWAQWSSCPQLPTLMPHPPLFVETVVWVVWVCLFDLKQTLTSTSVIASDVR